MITPTDVRIGNWVHLNGIPLKITAVSEEGYNGSWDRDGMYYSYEIEYPYDSVIDGIPLTPEILKKCGFQLQNLYYALTYEELPINL